MPSFLSKVFGRKKDDTKESRSQHRASSDASLLEGKFEAVPTTASPINPRFDLPADAAPNDKEKEKDGFALFKTKSARTPPVASTDQSVAHGKVLDYHLSLNLPGPKQESTRALGVVFEADPDAQILLPESAIAERRLSPLEAFLLVQACSQAINARGLETLGIMIPHWYSASPSVQRRLISLFIQSLDPKSPITTLSPTASSPVSAFESEISTTRSPHDAAAVLRWGLRHLQLDNSSFGKDEQWYSQFLGAEKPDYPPKAFSEKLVPLLPPAHLHLLTAALEIFSSLAAHGEANSISGSKLSKMFGLWILSTPRVAEDDDYLSFYAKWDKWGRVLEHLFLARIRDEAADHRMPTRLMELVKHYPYTKSPSPSADAAFLPSPRFSTRQYDALFVRIETEVPSTESKKHKNHPLRLIADALKASSRSATTTTPDASGTPPSSSELELWESLKRHVSVADADSESYPGLSSLFADETIRFLSLIPTASETGVKPQDPPPFTLFIPSTKVGRRRSMSLSDQDKAVAAVATAHAKAASASESNGVPTATSDDPLAIDWGQFSTSGFFSENGGSSGSKLAATLLDNKDVEVTIPRKPSARRKLPPALIPLPSSRGKSLDLPAPKEETDAKQGKSRATKFEIVQLDEAFIDFWSDALLDPISADWPAFVVCKIKSSVPAVNAANSKKVGWLIIEQRFVTPKPPPQTTVATPDTKEGVQARPRPTSPKPSFHSDSKSTKKKRFSFFTSLSSSSVSSSSTTRTDGTKGKKKANQGPKVGEMGEILKEEEEESAPASAKTNGTGPAVSSTQVAAIATGAVAVGATAAIAATAAEKPEVKEAPATLVEDAANTRVPTSPPAEIEQPSPAVDVTTSLVKDAADAQVADPTEPPAIASPDAPVVDANAAAAVEEQAVVEPEVAREPTSPPAPVTVETEPDLAPSAVEAPLEPEESTPSVVVAPVVIAPVPTPPVSAQPEPEEAVPETAVEEEPEAVEPEVIARDPSPPPVVEEPPVAAEPDVVAQEPTPPPPAVDPVVQAEVIARDPTPPPVVEEPPVAAEPEVVAREPTPPPPAVEPVVEPEVIARNPTPPPVVEEPPVVAAEPEVVAREPTPPPPVEPEVIAREPTPPPHVAEPEIEEPIVETEPEPEPAVIAREPTPPPVEVEEPVVETAAAIPRELTPPPAEPEVEEPVVHTEPEPEVVAREPTPPPVAEPVLEEPAVEMAPEPAALPREPTPPPVVDPEVEEPVVHAELEPEVGASEPTPLPAAEPVLEEPAVIAREPTPPPAAEPEVEAPIVETEPEPEVNTPPPAEPEVIAREPTPPPAIAEPEPEPPVEETAVEEPVSVPVEAPFEDEAVHEPEEPILEAAPEAIAREPTPPPAREPTPPPVVAEEPKPEVMIVNDEPVAVETPPVEEPVEVPPVEEAVEPGPMPIIEPAPQTAEGLQFDTAAEVIGSGHIEPLREPEAENDALVDLPAVPVVEAQPDLVRGSTMISHLELTPSPDVEAEKAVEATDDGLLPGGETPGPQVALNIAEESGGAEEAPVAAEEDAPVHETNGNGVNGHDNADKPSE